MINFVTTWWWGRLCGRGRREGKKNGRKGEGRWKGGREEKRKGGTEGRNVSILFLFLSFLFLLLMDEQTDLALLDNVGIHRIVSVTACVLSGVPLAAPHTGHAGHAPAGQTDG